MTCKRGRTGTVSGMLFFAARWAAEMPILRYVHILLMRSASAACLSIYCVCVIIGRTCGAIATYRSYVASDSAHLDASDWSSAIGCLPPSPIDDVIVATEKRLFQKLEKVPPHSQKERRTARGRWSLGRISVRHCSFAISH